MYVIMAPIQIRDGFRDVFVEATIEDARSTLASEPGCLRFDVIQDSADPNRIWLYEVYVDEAAFQAHLSTPHLARWREAAAQWRVDGPDGAGRGSYNIWPVDSDW